MTEPITVGVVTPHAAAGPEVELPAMTRGRLATVVSRTRAATESSPTSAPAVRPAHADLLASTGSAALDRAAVTFRGTTLAAVAHASTTSGYVLGLHGEAELIERLSMRFDVPAVASCAAAVAALRAHGAERIQLVHPPWFDDEFDELGAAYFRSHDFDTVVSTAVGIPRDPARVERQQVIDWVERHVEAWSEAVFLVGTGFRAAGAAEELERRTGRLVLEANQVMLWAVLAATGTRWDIPGHGRLLREGTSPT